MKVHSPIAGSEVSSKFRFQNRPKFASKLRFPDDITQLTSANISDLLGKYSQMYVFANEELCRANVRILELETQVSRHRTHLLRTQPSLNTIEKWRRDTVIETNIEVASLNRAKHEIEVEKLYAETFLQNYDKYILALSRELTRKMAETPLAQDAERRKIYR